MNTNSKDVVKNVESNNVESTSNEQRQTNKPIIVSRRRLLRAGVAGIPVVLTMAGIAPGQFGGVASAASGLDYDKKNTIGRFKSIHGDVLNNNLIYSDGDGFIFKNNNEGYYEETGKSSAFTPTNETGVTATITFSEPTGPTSSVPDVTNPSPTHAPVSSDLSFALELDAEAIKYQARLNKNGYYYTQQDMFTSDKSKFKPSLSSSSYPTNYTIQSITDANETVTIGNLDTTDWSNVHEPWRVVPNESKQVSVTYTATTTYKYTTPDLNNTNNDLTYTGTITVEVTFPVTVSVPEDRFEKETNW